MKNENQWSLLTLSALGVVYGDIATSPLYAFHAAMGDLPATPLNVLGVLSLIFWTLILIVSFKSITLIFRADNEGEGGILALLALLKQHDLPRSSPFFLLATLGAGFLFADGMLTPAISVSSAVEGLHLLYAHAHQAIIGLSCLILILLFMAQRYGSGKIGLCFGPIVLVWCLVIALLGLQAIIQAPAVWQAIFPSHALYFLLHHGFKGYLLLGGVFLVATGAEALYADIGHFGKQAIRRSWFFMVLPCLLLNYFGQGALLLIEPAAIENPFFRLCQPAFLMPLILLATVTTMIASQAIISATFSLTKQAMLLGLCPRMRMIQTSKYWINQIYIPHMNILLMLGALAFLLVFKRASGLTQAYGIGVNLEMMLITLMVAYVAYRVWGWSLSFTMGIFTFFIGLDSLFLVANLHKFFTGAWVPIGLALGVSLVMLTWKQGLTYLQETVYGKHPIIDGIAHILALGHMPGLPDMHAVFVADHVHHTEESFLNFLKMSLSFAEYIVIVTHCSNNRPYVSAEKRFSVRQLASNIYELSLHHGFMEHLAIPAALELANTKANLLPFKLQLTQVTYWVEILQVLVSRERLTHSLRFFKWQKRVFSFLIRNYSVNLNLEFYRLPDAKTISIGIYTQI